MSFKNKIVLLIAGGLTWLLVEIYYLRFIILSGGLRSGQLLGQAIGTISQLIMPLAIILFAVSLMDKKNAQQLLDDNDDTDAG